jgi:glycosyltransferase involved in cell wall biosynthesis
MEQLSVIHLVLGKANPDRMNGVNKVVHHLAGTQAATGLKVAVWGITPTPDEARTPQPYKLRYFRAKPTKWALDPQLKQAILDEKANPVVFHLHGAFIPEFAFAARLLRKAGIPYLFTPHGAYNAFAMQKSRLRKVLYLHLLEKKLLKGAKKVHLLGQSEKEGIEKFFRLKNLVTIPNGQFLAEKRAALPQNNSLIFGFCGRLSVFHKGLDIMLEGFKRYRNQGGSGLLWLIGDGNDRHWCESFALENDLPEQVIFWGSRYGKEKDDLLARMHAFLHSSRFEGIPTAVLEAGGLSLPLVISRGTNLASYVQEWQAGWVLQENTPEQLANVLHEVEKNWQEQTLPAYGQQARRMVENVFTWEKVSKQLLVYYTA